MFYLLAVNIIAFAMMGIDKGRAKRGAWRISEKALFISALIGGSIGAICGMQFFRHKTKHWYFKYGMPAILILQIAAIIALSALFTFLLSSKKQLQTQHSQADHQQYGAGDPVDCGKPVCCPVDLQDSLEDAASQKCKYRSLIDAEGHISLLRTPVCVLYSAVLQVHDLLVVLLPDPSPLISKPQRIWQYHTGKWDERCPQHKPRIYAMAEIFIDQGKHCCKNRDSHISVSCFLNLWPHCDFSPFLCSRTNMQYK